MDEAGVSRESEGLSGLERFLASTKQLLESLTKWSQGTLTVQDVSDVYVRMGNDFQSIVTTFRANGIDMSDLISTPDDFRRVLEHTLEQEATPETLEIYLPDLRAIIQNLLQGLHAKQEDYVTRKFYGSSSGPVRRDTHGLSAGPSLGSWLTNLDNRRESRDLAEETKQENMELRATIAKMRQNERERERVWRALNNRQAPSKSELVSQPAFKPDDPSGFITSTESFVTQLDKALPVDLPSRPLTDELKVVSQTMITREMATTEILEHLGRHGCNDVTGQLDTSKSSEYPISSGGYGDIYRSTFQDGNLVAVKCLRLRLDSTEISQKQLKRAAQEIYVWSKCVHPNVLGLTGVALYRNQLAMVSPWMEYGNLRQLLSREPEVDRYKLCAQIVDGIAYLHKSGVVHGDLKGDNVLFSADITPKLSDFGNATLKEYTLLFSQTTSRAGMSLNWVAPEVLKEETGITPEADIWSLGMTMLEVMTGEPPYAGIREFNIMRRIEGNIHPTRPEVHIPSQKRYADLIWSLFKACWTYDPPQRPNAVEVQSKMKVVIAEREIEQLNMQLQQEIQLNTD